MSEQQSPVTQEGLENWMKENCYNFNNYSINGNFIHEGFGIDKFGSLFLWYYTERGNKETLEYFQSEAEIISHALSQIKNDNWARTHCIGFTTNISEKKELEGILKNKDVEYFQDEIPYYGAGRPVYRTFVLGCAINKTKHLKDKFYKPL